VHGSPGRHRHPLAHTVPQELIFPSPPPESRCEIVGGSFLTDLPVDADAHLLKNTVIGMSDAHAEQAFYACRAAMGQRSRLLVIEELMGSGGALGPAAHLDLRMFVIFGEAELRTVAQLRALLGRGGPLCDEYRRGLAGGRHSWGGAGIEKPRSQSQGGSIASLAPTCRLRDQISASTEPRP
jgi:hypothetical protein